MVEAAGAAVTEFEVGDEVFGVKGGANAEYVCVREGGVLAHKPAGMSFEEAAAVCDGALLARTCLSSADLRQGRSIVVYGASGSSAPQRCSWPSTSRPTSLRASPCDFS